MSIRFGSYEFAGPFTDSSGLSEQEGVYVVVRKHHDQYEVLYVSQADNIKDHVEMFCPSYEISKGDSQILLAACYAPGSTARQRTHMADELRNEYRPRALAS